MGVVFFFLLFLLLLRSTINIYIHYLLLPLRPFLFFSLIVSFLGGGVTLVPKGRDFFFKVHVFLSKGIDEWMDKGGFFFFLLFFL